MIAGRPKKACRLVALTAVAVLLVALAPASAAAVEPSKWVLSGHAGTGVESEQPGGLSFPETVGAAPNGDFYVGDNVNQRVQEFTPTGAFVLMFGWNVNKTRVAEPAATQAQKNLCTAEEVTKGAVCGSGEAGDGHSAQMIADPQAIAVDPSDGNVYVYDLEYHRVDEFTSTGEFVLMIGGEVNETNDGTLGASESEKNICTAASGATCKAGVLSAKGSKAQGAFNPEAIFKGTLLSVGGPEHLLYIGDEGRLQKLDGSDGSFKGEVELPTSGTHVQALAVNPAGEAFVAESAGPGVHLYNAKGERQTTTIDPAGANITAIALDAYGRLGILEYGHATGLLYKASGDLVSEFAPPSGALGTFHHGLAFDTGEPAEPLSDRLYVPEQGNQEVEIYSPVLFPDVHTCAVGSVSSTSAALCGEINPNGLAAKGSFEYTPPAGGTNSPVLFEGSGTVFETFHWTLTGLEPNQTYTYRAIVQAELEGKPQQLQGAPIEFHTMTPPPEVPGTPVASFVGSSSAVLSASLNPEHAPASYHFEYGACPTLTGCPTVQSTAVESAGQYGLLGVAQEAGGLAAGRTYAYRLVANNEHAETREGKTVTEGGHSESEEAHFTTAPAPVPSAITGSAQTVASTTATIYGSVDPDGQPAVYAFEVGIYNGPQTSFGTVFTASVTGSVPVQESLGLSGLQPGVQYAYRIRISSGYGTATGEPATFTTTGLPAALGNPTPLTQVALPSIAFPVESGSGPVVRKVTKGLGSAQKLARALRACGKTRSSKKRAACRRQAHKKYAGKSKQANNKRG